MTGRKASVEQFLHDSAGKQPTPGGGSVAALVGALSAAMGEMVLNYSVNKKGLEAFKGEMDPALQELNRARAVLTEMMEEDQAAYEAMSAARRLPETDPSRQKEFDIALLAGIRIPETIAATSVAVLEVADRMVNFVNRYLLSDLAVCADLAMASTRCAIYNVRANLKDVTDPDDRRKIEATINHLLSRASVIIQRVSPRIWERESLGT